VQTRSRRNAIAGTFLLIGAFISMLTRITNLTIGGFQGFTADKSLIESLYSWQDSDSAAGPKKEGADDLDGLLDQN